MKFKGLTEEGAMPISEGECYQIFNNSVYIPNHKQSPKYTIPILADMLRELASQLESHCKAGIFTVQKRKTFFQPRAIKAEKLDLVTIDMSANLVDPPAAYYLGSEDTNWRMNVRLTLDFDENEQTN